MTRKSAQIPANVPIVPFGSNVQFLYGFKVNPCSTTKSLAETSLYVSIQWYSPDFNDIHQIAVHLLTANDMEPKQTTMNNFHKGCHPIQYVLFGNRAICPVLCRLDLHEAGASPPIALHCFDFLTRQLWISQQFA